MVPKNRVPTNPGEILYAEFLAATGIKQSVLARHLHMPARHISELVHGKRKVTPETAWKLAQAFATTPEFWLNLQIAHDLAVARPKQKISRLKIAA